MGQERLGPSHFFIPLLVLNQVPINNIIFWSLFGPCGGTATLVQTRVKDETRDIPSNALCKNQGKGSISSFFAGITPERGRLSHRLTEHHHVHFPDVLHSS